MPIEVTTERRFGQVPTFLVPAGQIIKSPALDLQRIQAEEARAMKTKKAEAEQEYYKKKYIEQANMGFGQLPGMLISPVGLQAQVKAEGGRKEEAKKEAKKAEKEKEENKRKYKKYQTEGAHGQAAGLLKGATDSSRKETEKKKEAAGSATRESDLKREVANEREIKAKEKEEDAKEKKKKADELGTPESKREAEKAKAEADKAKVEAEKAKAEADKAKIEADALMVQANQALQEAKMLYEEFLKEQEKAKELGQDIIVPERGFFEKIGTGGIIIGVGSILLVLVLLTRKK